MTRNKISKRNYYLVGLAIGSLMGVLFAPKSGIGIRAFMAKKAREGNELARRKAREMRDRAEDTVARGNEMTGKTKGQIATAIDVGREAYHRERSKARVS